MFIKYVCFICLLAVSTAGAADDVKGKAEKKISQYQKFETDPVIVAEVVAYNSNPPAVAAGMNQDKWKSLTILSPEVKAFITNKLGAHLKTLKDDGITELFVSGANGCKVAFLAKTSGWCHKGKAKHDVPMTGKTWIGDVETDESSGKMQIQIALPVLDGGKPIGSIVIGLDTTKL